jgi:sugar/nucleoside kinase (ribokinase family)
MDAITPLTPIDYLVIGHITCDLTENGMSLGGTASYASLTARSLGLRVGIVTSWGKEISLEPLADIAIINTPSTASTTFKNIYTDSGRQQIIHSIAAPLDEAMVPEPWKNTPIVHLGPIAGEVAPDLVGSFPHSLVGITPQGWFRSWDKNGHIRLIRWQEAPEILPKAGVTILSTEDVGENEYLLDEMAMLCPVFVVTEGYYGARVYWHGDVRRFSAPAVVEVNATGAGDIFAAAFFIRYLKTKNPWEAARFANQIASQSVTRSGLASVPNDQEVNSANSEVF